MIKYLGYVAGLSLLVFAALVYIDNLKSTAFESGYNKSKVECDQERVEANNQNLSLIARQRDAYRSALDMRNQQVEQIKDQYERRIEASQRIETHEICSHIRIRYPD